MKEAIKKLTPNELPEWAAWNKNNWLLILSEYESYNPKGESSVGLYDFSAWLWMEYPERVDYLAETNPRNYDELMLKVWNESTDWVFGMDGGEDMPDLHWLESCTVEVDGETRPATQEELDYFNDWYGVDIEDAAREYWTEKCF